MDIERLTYILPWLFFFASAAAWGERPPSSRTIVAPMVRDMPRIDGRLDDAVWAGAARVTGFIQTEPHNGEEATQTTEVYIAYTAEALLIGARLADSEPARIVATEYRRDARLDADDSFEIFLDTFHDRRNTFYFATNPVGAKRDGLINNEGSVLNWEWDGVWDVACSRGPEGWIAEFAIPFSTLRFRPGSPEGWGLNFGRLVARSREQSYWAPLDRDLGYYAKWRVSEYGTLQGLTGARRGGRLQVKPYLLGGVEQDFADEPGDADFRRDVGLDAKVGLTATLMADYTANTDFAQVESDQQQVNLTRFPLFFPEKREFFLENAGLFQVGELVQGEWEPPSTLLFFSRRIGLYDDEYEVPILGGARLTGKLGRYDIGAFDIVTRSTQIDEETTVPATNFAAFRIKRDLFARSSIGGLVLSKSPADEGSYNRVIAADFNLNPSNSTTFHGFAAKSFTPGLTGASHALAVDGARETDKTYLFGTYAEIGEDFNSEMGFLQRTGIRKARGAALWSPRPGWGGIRQIFLGDYHTYITDREGNLETQYNWMSAEIHFNDGSVAFGGWNNMAEGLTEPFEIRDGVEVPIGEYRFDQATFHYRGSRSRSISVSWGVDIGGFYSGTIRSVNGGVQLRPHGRVGLSLEYFRNRVDLPVEGGRFVTNLAIMRAVFAFSPRAYIRSLFQYNDDDDKAAANVLFRYTYRPGADIFVVYNEERDTGGSAWSVAKRELLVKVTFYFVPL
jgi:hypothetical protein